MVFQDQGVQTEKGPVDQVAQMEEAPPAAMEEATASDNPPLLEKEIHSLRSKVGRLKNKVAQQERTILELRKEVAQFKKSKQKKEA